MSTEAAVGQDWCESLKKSLDKTEKYASFLEEFSKCTSNEARISKLYSLSEVHSIVKVDVKKNEKNAGDAIRFRDEGNKLFQKRHNQEALDLYTRSVLAAPSCDDTSVLALALANRSAVLFHMKLYDRCLLDIEAALKNDYPLKLRYKLHERRGKCYYQLRMKVPAKQAFEEGKTDLRLSGLDQTKLNNLINDYDKQIWQCDKLAAGGTNMATKSNPFHSEIPSIGTSIGKQVNPNVPQMSDALDIVYSEKTGRGLVAVKDIGVGELLVVEKPYASTILPTFSFNHCHHCCTRVIAPVACLRCTKVVFCDENCRRESWDSYHKYECDILGTVRGADISLGHLALKMILKFGFEGVNEFDEEMYSKVDDKTKIGFNEDGIYNSQDYRTVFGLVNHTEDRKVEELLNYSLQAVFILKCLETTDFFGQSVEERVTGMVKRFCVGGHILRQLQMLPCNAHECSELAVKFENVPESVTMEIGSAIYPILSLINHSCDPNVVRHSYGDVCVVRSIRNIRKGEDVFDNYGALYALTPCQKRREKLAPQYFFTCNCLACLDDYSLYFDTPTDVPVFKCEKCAGPVFMPMATKYTKVACSSCKHWHDLTARLGHLGQSDETYRVAMHSVLTDTSGNLERHIPTLEGHLELMDRLLCRPWRDYNDCQEALKQCYSLQASHFAMK